MKNTLRIITIILALIESVIAVLGFFEALAEGFSAAAITLAISIAVFGASCGDNCAFK